MTFNLTQLIFLAGGYTVYTTWKDRGNRADSFLI